MADEGCETESWLDPGAQKGAYGARERGFRKRKVVAKVPQTADVSL